MPGELGARIDLSAITAWASATWKDPSPETMDVLLRAMDKTLERLSSARAELFATWIPARNDLEDVLRDWDRRANQLWFRLGAYHSRTDAMLAGEITGEFTGYVVQPILVGHGYASPEREAWSKVDFADILTVFRLWNELGAFAEGTEGLDFLRREARALVAGFGEIVRDEATRVVGAIGAELQEQAADLISRAEEIVSEKREELSSTIVAAIVGGAALLGGAAYFLSRRARRRRRS